jgi:hypothetical protein
LFGVQFMFASAAQRFAPASLAGTMECTINAKSGPVTSAFRTVYAWLFQVHLFPRQQNPSSVGHSLPRTAGVRPNYCCANGIIWPRIQVISYERPLRAYGLPNGRESASASAETRALCGTIRSCAPSAAPHIVRRDACASLLRPGHRTRLRKDQVRRKIRRPGG